MSEKLLLVNAVSSRMGGGLNDLVHTIPLLCERMQSEGWRVRTYVSTAGQRALGQNSTISVEVASAKTLRQRAIWETFTLPGIVRREQPNVVFHFSNFVSRNLPCPQMVVLRSPTFYSPDYQRLELRGFTHKVRQFLGKRIARSTPSRADATFCISAAQRDDVCSQANKVNRDVLVSHLGCEAPPESVASRALSFDERLNLASPPVRRQLQRFVDQKRNPNLILNIAHYTIQKNLIDLLCAVQQLVQSGEDVVLVITAGLLNYRGRVTSAVKRELDVARSLDGMGALIDLGSVSRQDVWALLSMADVFAFPSSVESFGHPLLEAQAMGVPLVASATDVHREVAGEGALYYELGNVTQLANQISKLLNDSNLATQLVEKGKSNSRTFTWESHVDDLVQKILQLAQCEKP